MVSLIKYLLNQTEIRLETIGQVSTMELHNQIDNSEKDKVTKTLWSK